MTIACRRLGARLLCNVPIERLLLSKGAAMDRIEIIEEIAAICRRLAKLSQAHREAMSGDDIDLVLRVQAESAKLHKAVEELRQLSMKREPPGTRGRSVRDSV